jgi:hypothetical protein
MAAIAAALPTAPQVPAVAVIPPAVEAAIRAVEGITNSQTLLMQTK